MDRSSLRTPLSPRARDEWRWFTLAPRQGHSFPPFSLRAVTVVAKHKTRGWSSQVTKRWSALPCVWVRRGYNSRPYWLLRSSSVLVNLLALDFQYILQRDWRTIMLSGHCAMMKVVSGWRQGQTCQQRVGWNTRLPSLSGRPRVCRQPTFWQTAHECLLACISPLSNNLLMPHQYPNVKMACQRKITLKRDIEIQMMSLVVIANERTRYMWWPRPCGAPGNQMKLRRFFKSMRLTQYLWDRMAISGVMCIARVITVSRKSRFFHLARL